MGNKNDSIIILSMLSLLLILSFIGISAAVNICPVEKKPTEMSITHSQLPRNEPIGVFNNKINVQILLEWVDRATGERGPLPGKNVTVTMMILDKYLKMQSDGSFQLVSSESNFIVQTDTDGKIDLSVIVDPFNPKKVSYSITADYIPATKDSYIGSTANAKYTPTSMPLFSLAACLPLVLILGMLMGAMYVSGRNPLGALDLSRAAFRVPGVERRAVKGTIKPIGGGVGKNILPGVGGDIARVTRAAVGVMVPIAARLATRFAAKTVRQVGGTALKGVLKPKTIWVVGKGAVNTALAVGKFAYSAPGEAGKKAKVVKTTELIRGTENLMRYKPSEKKVALAKPQREELKGLRAGEEYVFKEKKSLKTDVSESWGAFTASMSQIGHGISKGTETSRAEVKKMYNQTIVYTYDRIMQGDLSVLGNLTGGERTQSIAGRTTQSKQMSDVYDRLMKENRWSATEAPSLATAQKKLDRKEISQSTFDSILKESKLREQIKNTGQIRIAKKELDNQREKFEKSIDSVKKEIEYKTAKEDIANIKKESNSAMGLSKTTVNAVLGQIAENFKTYLSKKEVPKNKIDSMLSYAINDKATAKQLIEKFPELAKDEKIAKNLEKLGKIILSLGNTIDASEKLAKLKENTHNINNVYEAARHLTDKDCDINRPYKDTKISPNDAIKFIHASETGNMIGEYKEAEKAVGVVYAAVNLKGDTDKLESILRINLGSNLNDERVKEKLTKQFGADLAKYIDVEGSFAQIGMNVKKISWTEQQGVDSDGKPIMVIVNLPKEDVDKFINGLKKEKFTNYIDKGMGLQDINEKMLDKMGISGKSAEKILDELQNEKSDLKAGMPNSLKIINDNAKNYLGYDFDQLKDGKITDRLEQKLKDLGIEDQKSNMKKFAMEGSSAAFKEIAIARGTPAAEADKLAAETTVYVKMIKENGTLLADFLEGTNFFKNANIMTKGGEDFFEGRMTEGERHEYRKELDMLRSGVTEMTKDGKTVTLETLSDFIKKDKITTKDFEKYIDNLTDFTPSGYLQKPGAGFAAIDKLTSLSIAASQANISIPVTEIIEDPSKAGANAPAVLRDLRSELQKEGVGVDATSAKLKAEIYLADENKLSEAITKIHSGDITSSESQLPGIVAGISYAADSVINKENSNTAASVNPKLKDQIDKSRADNETETVKNYLQQIAETAKQSSIVTVRTVEERPISGDNPLNKDTTTTVKTLKIYDGDVDNTSELFRRTATDDLADWKPTPETESFVHKNNMNDGGHIDFKNEELAKQRLKALVISAIENKAPYGVVSNSEVTFGDVSVKVDKDKLYILKKRTMVDMLPGKSSSEKSA